MKALYTFFLGCFCVGVMLAQSDIASVEYYFDTDPGIGNGIILDIDPDIDILDQNFNISTTGLSQGTHRLFLRVVNVDGSSSMYTHKTFRIYDLPATNSTDIVEAEFFFNTDPGFGNGNIRAVSNATVMNRNFSFSTAGLPVGTHKLYFRVKNSNNQWSMYTYKTFRKSDVPLTNIADIVEAEYYFNTDPGLGNGTNIDVADVGSLDENFSIATSSLAIGTHRMFMRVKNSNNSWSMYDNKTFRVFDVPEINTASIVAAEYFIDVDPGFGSATALSVSGDNLDENLTIPTSASLAQGDHYLHIRVLNADGSWSLYDRKLFEIDGTLGIDSDDLSEIRIFPIPTSDYVNIKTPYHIQIKSIGIIDLNGKVVMQLNNPVEKINLSNLQQGVYLLQIQTQNGNLSKRIIKN